MDETENQTPGFDELLLRELRHAALQAAIQMRNEHGDYQEVIRSARDILAFLKDG